MEFEIPKCQWAWPTCEGYEGDEKYRWIHVQGETIWMCRTCHGKHSHKLADDERNWDILPESPFGGAAIDELYETAPFEDTTNDFIQNVLEAAPILEDLRSDKAEAFHRMPGFCCHHKISMPAACGYVGNGIYHILTTKDDDGLDHKLYVCMKIVVKSNLPETPNETNISHIQKLKLLRENTRERQTIAYAVQKYNSGGGIGNINQKKEVISNAEMNIPTLTHALANSVTTIVKKGRFGSSWHPEKACVYEPKAQAADDADASSAKGTITKMNRTHLGMKIYARPVICHKMNEGDLFCYALAAFILKAYALYCLENQEIVDLGDFIESI